MDLRVDEIQKILLGRKIIEQEVGRETVYRWLRKGYFPGAYKAIGLPGRPWRIPPTAIDKFEERWKN